ncbi:MAG: DUF4325 domain-containing protein [Methanobrevibacter sp.]|jgi:hypothetical protein|nr:DUF4325 domain-containing protein [Methanobrevibacter sp.]
MFKEIKLSEISNTDLIMGHLAEDLFKNMNDNTHKIIVDFNGVGFMSRAFAQEYIYQKEQISIEIEEKNMTENVRKLFNVVINHYNKNKHEISD